MTGFNPQPSISGYGIALAPLCEADREGLFAAAAHPEVWAGHPAKDRYKPEVFHPYFDFLLETGHALTIRDSASGEIIGTSSFYPAPDHENSISIGFTFLTNSRWGGTTNFAVKRLMHEHAFAHFDEIWFHIAPDNIRSQKATSKLGARFRYDAALEIGGPAKEWKCYALSQKDWEAVVKERAF